MTRRVYLPSGGYWRTNGGYSLLHVGACMIVRAYTNTRCNEGFLYNKIRREI